MEVTVNYLAVFLAALSSMAVGGIWYAPKVFGGAWMKLAKVDPNRQFTAADSAVMYGGAFVLSLLTAYVLAHVTFLSHNYFNQGYLAAALTSAFWLWLGLMAARLGVHDLFEGRLKKLTLINVAHEFVTIMVMALIIGAMGVPVL